MPDLHGVARQAESVLDAGEELVGEGDLVGPVHLRLDDVDRAGAAVARRACRCRSCIAIAVVITASMMPSGTSPGRRVEDRVGGHQVADVAHQHQAAPVQGEVAAVRAE